MNDENQSQSPTPILGAKRQKTGAQVREDRLKAALKANMARRKAQAKARMGQDKEESQGQ